jgi:hypothetical protein
MCRNIRPLFNMEPASSTDDVRASALQYVRKVSGYTRPSKANEAAFNEAVERIAAVTADLLESLTTTAPPRSRELQIERARERATRRQQSA